MQDCSLNCKRSMLLAVLKSLCTFKVRNLLLYADWEVLSQRFDLNARSYSIKEVCQTMMLHSRLFPTLAVGLLDFKVDVVLARLEADFCDQAPSIPAVPNHQVSLQWPTTKNPCSAEPQSIPAVPNCRVSLQSACSVQPPNIPAGPNRKASLQCPTAEYPWSAQHQSTKILAAHLQCCKEDS